MKYDQRHRASNSEANINLLDTLQLKVSSREFEPFEKANVKRNFSVLN